MKDLNTTDIDKAVSIVAGTARSMGVEIEEIFEDISKWKNMVRNTRKLINS